MPRAVGALQSRRAAAGHHDAARALKLNEGRARSAEAWLVKRESKRWRGEAVVSLPYVSSLP